MMMTMASNGKGRPSIYPSWGVGVGRQCLFWISVITILPSITISNEVPFDKDNKLVPPTQVVKTQPDLTCVPSAEFGCLNSTVTRTLQGTCPDAKPKIWRSYAPQGQKAAGVYTELQRSVTTPEECATECCLNATCHYAFTANTTCYLLNCVYGSYLCEPSLFKEQAVNTNFSMVLIRTAKSTPMTGITCEVGEGTSCKAHQRCIPINHRSRNGICVCETGFDFDADKKECVEGALQNVMSGASTTTTPAPPVELTVSVSSKNVTLPDNEVSLSAYVVPQAPSDHPYSYKWTLLSNPKDDTAAVEGQTTDTLRLTGLKEGKYVFQVTASNTLQSNGSSNATINVFPELKPNEAPIAVISPQDQTIQLPTSSAVLDASLSTDDDKIISYKWELQKSPILFALNPSKSLNSSTLQVENLIPGNYTFKLIVEDNGHVINSTTANITVIKEPDYPPTANPGKDIVIYLPQTEVILNGNASTDDKKIVEFEWKASGEQTKAIDMQDTHTPYLKLSHLQIGLYQFELKVTDEAGQSSSATVHVVVKEATGNPPNADAGVDQSTVLNKQNWVTLDGSKSKSDSNKITHYNWTQISGPNNATIFLMEKNGIRANVSGLTKGEYEFLLVVEDESKLRGNDTVKINVFQRVNEPPHANAGGSVEVKLPVSLVLLNGSASNDDVKIWSWAWERQPDSLAAGTILPGSEVTPILQLTDLVPGKFIFKLTVKDEQGTSNEDIAVLTVTGESHEHDLVEVVLGVSLNMLTESDKNKVIQQLSLLLHDTKLVLNHIGSQLHSGNAVLQLHGEDKAGEVINGSVIAEQLRRRLYQDSALSLQFPIYSIDTALCLDECSGHGICQDTPDGRECVCSAFWMENFLKRKFGNKERNCEWSKIYVGVIVSLLLTMVFALMWSLSFIFRRNFRALKESPNNSSHSNSPNRSNGKRNLSNKKQYTLLDDDEEEMDLRTQEDEDDAESEDSDSDILFETNNKRSNKSKNGGGLLMIPLTGNGIRNGILKNARRTKT